MTSLDQALSTASASKYNDELSVRVSKPNQSRFNLSLADHPGEFSLASYLAPSWKEKWGEQCLGEVVFLLFP